MTKMIYRHTERGAANHILTFFSIIILGVAIYFFCFSAEGPGFALPKHERVYNICMQKNKNNMKASDTGMSFAGIANSLSDSVQNVGCKAMSELCKKLPDSCDELLEKVSK